MKKGITTVGFLLIILHSLQAQQTEVRLDSLKQIALENNPGIQSAFNQWHASLEQSKVAGSLPEPSVAFGYFAAPVETRLGPQEYRAGLSQSLPWFGSLKFASRAAQLQAEADYYRLQDKKNKVLQQLAIAYYKGTEAALKKDIQREHKKWLELQQGWIRQSYESGNKSLADLVRIRMAIEKQDNIIRDYRDEAANYRYQVNRIANREETARVTFADTLSVGKMISRNGQADVKPDSLNPSLLALLKKQQAKKMKEKAVQRANYPSLKLGVEYISIGERVNTTIPDNGRDAVVGKISLNVPVYRNKNKAEEAILQYEAQSMNEQFREKKNNLYARLNTLSTKMKVSERAIALANRNIKDARLVERLLKTEYSSGKAGFDEWMDVQRELLNYKEKTVAHTAEIYRLQAKRKAILNRFFNKNEEQ